MPARYLRIGTREGRPDLKIAGEQAVTRSFGFLGMRGSGKSNGAVVLAEEFYRAGLPWVAIDPKGDWWGIRSSATGRLEGLPVVIFGGEHGDVPLEPTAKAGTLVADTILGEHISAIVDLSTMTKGQKVTFLAGNGPVEGFAGRLFRLKRREDGGLHVFLEEAHDYVPQQARGELGKLIDVISNLQTMGRTRGFGCSVISQRSARVHKDVLSQVDTLVAFRTVSPQDRAAIRDWVEGHGLAKELVDSLPSLADGESWLWSPEWLGSLERIQWRRRETYDSGSTPVGAQTPRRPQTLADVDLGAINKAMAETIERATAEDPKTLRATIARLEAEIANERRAVAALEQYKHRPPEQVEVRVEVPKPYVPPHVVAELRQFSERVAGLIALAEEVPTLEAVVSRRAAPRPAPVIPAAGFGVQTHGDQSGPDRARTKAPATPREPYMTGDLAPADRRFLTALAQYPDGLQQTRLSLITGYKVSGHFKNVLGRLRSAGYVAPGWPSRITDAGRAALGDYEPLPAPGPALVEHWLSDPKLGAAHRRMLEVFTSAYPAEVPREEVSERTGYRESGHFKNVLGRLRGLGLVDGLRASDDLMGGA